MDSFQIPRNGQFFDSAFLKRYPEQAVLSKFKEPPNTENYGPPSVCVLLSAECWFTVGIYVLEDLREEMQC